MPQTDWKPGPPPLDKPGRFDCVNRFGSHDAITISRSQVTYGNGWRPKSEVDLSWVEWHYHIPDPPETET